MERPATPRCRRGCMTLGSARCSSACSHRPRCRGKRSRCSAPRSMRKSTSAIAFDRQLHQLLERLASAVERPAIAPVTEDYVLFRILTLRDASGASVAPAVLTDDHLVPLLLGEQRRLSEAARRE